MTAPAWPGLGFDPAPGDPVAAGGLVTQLTDTARHLRETHDVLASVQQQRGTWTGEASKAFAAKLDGLPGYLASAQSSLQRAGGALDQWQGTLSGLQTRAQDLEAQARAARARLDGAEDTARTAAAHPDLRLFGKQFSAEELAGAQRRADEAQDRVNRALAAVNGLRSSLEDLLRRGEALRAEHEGEARRTADGIRRADDGLAPPEPAWFEQAGAWLKDNLDTIGDVAGFISSVASTLAFIPVLTPFMAPLALIATGVALVAHSADLVVNEKWTDGSAYMDIGGDVLGLLPVLGPAADGMMASFRTVDGLTPALSAAVDGVRLAIPEIRSVHDAGAVAGAAADVLKGWGVAGDAALIAKGLDGSFIMGTQVPTVAEWITGDEYTEASEAAAAGGLIKNAADIGFGDLLDETADAVAAAAAAAT